LIDFEESAMHVHLPRLPALPHLSWARLRRVLSGDRSAWLEAAARWIRAHVALGFGATVVGALLAFVAITAFLHASTARMQQPALRFAPEKSTLLVPLSGVVSDVLEDAKRAAQVFELPPQF
jgi:hypothetical protein